MEGRFKKWKKPKIKHGKFTKWNWLVFHPKNLVLGNRVDIGALTLIQAKNGVEIGDETQIGPHCYISSWDTERGIEGKIVILDHIMIGAHSVILPKKNEVHIIDKNIKARSVVY